MRSNHPWPWILFAIVGFSALYSDVLAGLVRDWLTDDNYAHGILVIPIAAYIAWERRARLKSLPLRPSWIGAAVVGSSLMLLVAGTAALEFFLQRLSMIGVLAGAIVLLCGWAHLRALAFPLAFLLLMIPLPAIVFNQIAFPLQLVATRAGVSVLEFLSIPVLREGNVIVLANTTLEVAEACSGIRSLISLLTVAIVYGFLMDYSGRVRVLLAGLSVPVAIAANGARVAAVGVLAQNYGAETANGFVHTVSGWLLFALSAIVLVSAGQLLGATARALAPVGSAPRVARS